MKTTVYACASLALFTPAALAQFGLSSQERSVQGTAQLTSGQEDSGFAEAPGYGVFDESVDGSVSGTGGAMASIHASQFSTITPSTISGTLEASGQVATGSTFVVGQSDGWSNFLVLFSLAAPTPVTFTASGSMSFVGINPDGEPADLYGVTRVSLLDADTFDPIAGFSFQGGDYDQSAEFAGTLAAGNYAIIARAEFHAYSADLLGPPARSGSGESTAAFSLTVVPAPASALLMSCGLLCARRRR